MEIIPDKSEVKMYNIPIDENNYHSNSFTEQELLWATEAYRRVIRRYGKLDKFIKDTAKPLCLSDSGTEQLLTTVTLAFCHTMKVYGQPNTVEQVDKTLKTWIYSFFPYIVQNLLSARYSHPVQFEPITVSCRYFTISAYNAANGHFDPDTLSEFELYVLHEIINLLRAVGSSITLFSIGDDVHGVSIYRGAMEIYSKIILAQKFPDEYVLFKNFNLHLQKHKQNDEPIPEEMTEYLKDEPQYKAHRENFLAYGWARDDRGVRILSMKQLIYNVVKENREDVETFIQLASEFTHEDYVGIGYDYIEIRKKMLEQYYNLIRAFCHENALNELLPPKLIKAIRHLFTLTDRIYAESLPLIKN